MTQLSCWMNKSQHSQYKDRWYHNYRNRLDRKIDRHRKQHKCRWKLICNCQYTTQLSCWMHTFQHAVCMGYCFRKDLCFDLRTDLQHNSRMCHYGSIADNLVHTKQLLWRTRTLLHSTGTLIRHCDTYRVRLQTRSTSCYRRTDHRMK